MANRIHPIAVISPQVSLGDGKVIGPYTVLQGPVRIGDGNYLGSHVPVCAGPDVRSSVRPGRKEATDEGGVLIGPPNVFKEYVAVNTGWAAQALIGDACPFTGSTYLAHDTRVQDRVTTSWAVLVGGHAVLEADANLGMGCAVHQRRVVGAASMVGMRRDSGRASLHGRQGCAGGGDPAKTFRLDRLGVPPRPTGSWTPCCSTAPATSTVCLPLCAPLSRPGSNGSRTRADAHRAVTCPLVAASPGDPLTSTAFGRLSRAPLFHSHRPADRR